MSAENLLNPFFRSAFVAFDDSNGFALSVPPDPFDRYSADLQPIGIPRIIAEHSGLFPVHRRFLLEKPSDSAHQTCAIEKCTEEDWLIASTLQ